MEFLLLAVLGLVALGTTSAASSDEETAQSGGQPSAKKGEKGKEKGKEDEKPKSPEQKLMEAIAEYESNPPKDKKIKISFEVQDRD